MNNNKLNNKGYMLVEIIVASVIALVMAYFLIDITVKFANKNNDFYVESVLLTDKAVITKEIMDDINNKKLIKIEEKNESEFELYYDDNTSKKLTIDSDNSMITYGDYSKKISEELNPSDISLKNSNNILTISLDMYTNYSDNDYGIEINVPHSEDIEIVYADLPRTFDKIKDRYTCKKTTDFSEVSTTDEGLCEAEDDLGTSYYFRGNVNYNYVSFAGYTWRIVRMNGDGSLRIILNSSIGTSQYDDYNFEYVYEEKGTKNNTTIKSILDSWYKTNILDKNYGNYVADSIFCNDLDNALVLYADKKYHFATSERIYGAKHRLETNKNPSFICGASSNEEEWEKAYNKEYSAVVSQITGLNISDKKVYSLNNGTLKYPIGLLSADEVSFAGGLLGKNNKSYYLYNGSVFWTMSPEDYNNDSVWNCYMYIVDYEGAIDSTRISWEQIYSTTSSYPTKVRPVISLRNDLKFEGSGTKDDPFKIYE